MKLPFDQIAPGAFATAFPKSPTTGLPAAHQGVEEQVRKLFTPPPMINTVASDAVAKQGMMGAPPMPADAAPTAAEAARMWGPRPSAAPVNPFGSMDPRPLSERRSGGPMSYSPRGVGTTSPFAFAVGQNNKNFDQRTGQPPGIGAFMAQGIPSPALSPETFFGSAKPAPAAPGSLAFMTSAPPGSRDATFWADEAQKMNTFFGEQQKVGADMQAADAQTAADAAKQEQAMQVTTTPVPGTDYVIPFAGSKAMGTLPVQRPEAPLPPGMMPTQAMRGGVTYETPQAGKTAKPNISWQTAADGLTKIPYETITDPKTGQTMLRKVKIMDENGDGIDDATQGGDAAGWQSWAEQ